MRPFLLHIICVITLFSSCNWVDMVIANGARMEALYDIVEGKNVGTRFSARRGALQ